MVFVKGISKFKYFIICFMNLYVEYLAVQVSWGFDKIHKQSIFQIKYI